MNSQTDTNQDHEEITLFLDEGEFGGCYGCVFEYPSTRECLIPNDVPLCYENKIWRIKYVL